MYTMLNCNQHTAHKCCCSNNDFRVMISPTIKLSAGTFQTWKNAVS